MMTKLKVAGAALNQLPLDWEGNTKRIKAAIKAAQQQNVDVLCLPELCITGYGCEDQFLSSWIYDKSWEILRDIIPLTKDIFVAIGLPYSYLGQRYDTVAFIADQYLYAIIPKQFLAIDGVHYESRWFVPGNKGIIASVERDGMTFEFGDVIFAYKGCRIGTEICEDMWRGDQRPVHFLADRGVDIIVNPSASHFALGKTKQRESIILDASKKYNITYVYANLLGNEAGRMIYDGDIMIASSGKMVAKKRFTFEDVSLLTSSDGLSTTLGLEEEFTAAISLGLFDYMRKSRSNGFVLSLSGGADSSTIAVLVREMVRRGVAELGYESFCQHLRVAPKDDINAIMKSIFHTAYQGTVNSSKATFDSAKALATEIGANFYHWTIDEQVNSYTKTVENALNTQLNWEDDDIVMQNIQARARSPIIWMLANKFNCLLLTTSNRSEGDVGYTTMDGDTSGSLAPIAAIDKDFILKWLKWAEKELGYKSLSHVNSLQPSAELRPLDKTQTDETDLMPYHWLKKIEREAIFLRKSPLQVFDALKRKDLDDGTLKVYITRFFRLWSRNQWKRERIAPAFHLDEFNVDPRAWCRFPILSSGFEEELNILKNI